MAIDETVLTEGLMRKLNALLSAAATMKRSSRSGWSARLIYKPRRNPIPWQ